MRSFKSLNFFFIIFLIGLGVVALKFRGEAKAAKATAKKTEIALQESIERYAKEKATDLVNYGKNYEDLEENGFACDSYRKAFVTLDTIAACRVLPIYKEIIELRTNNCEDE